MPAISSGSEACSRGRVRISTRASLSEALARFSAPTYSQALTALPLSSSTGWGTVRVCLRVNPPHSGTSIVISVSSVLTKDLCSAR